MPVITTKRGRKYDIAFVAITAAVGIPIAGAAPSTIEYSAPEEEICPLCQTNGSNGTLVSTQEHGKSRTDLNSVSSNATSITISSKYGFPSPNLTCSFNTAT